MSRTINSLSSGGKILLEILEKTLNSTIGDDFFLTKSGMRKFARRLAMNEINLVRNLNRLEKNGLLRQNDREFVITPKGLRYIQQMKVENDDWADKEWDGLWKIVIFDIPEKKKSAREALRRFLQRKNFYRLQDSVFISPFADLNALNFIRYEYGISENVNIFISKSADIDDDKKLKEHFKLK